MVSAQAFFGTPSTRVRQQPHGLCGAQPFLTEVIFRFSRSTSSSSRSGVACTWTGAPLREN